MTTIRFPKLIASILAAWFLVTPGAIGQDKLFRPEAGKFPPLEKSRAYRGVLSFLDHTNRRGSLRVASPGEYFRNPPHPFAMLPYGIVRYHGAPADLRDIPLGTLLHVRAFLPPDPKNSAVPPGRRDHPERPEENHVLLLEDEPSLCLREGKVWKLMELEISNNQGMITGTQENKAETGGKDSGEKLTFDASTRIWRGRERLGVEDLIAEGTWPGSGKKSLAGQPVHLGLTWVPTPDGVFLRFHISDIWLDEPAIRRAAQNQTEAHKAFIRSRWMPARVDTVEYGRFGSAKITATLFGGMDPSLYGDFKKGSHCNMNSVENTLKHTHGAYSPAHMASAGSILDVKKLPGPAPVGSSGIQIRFETDLVIEGIRPGRIVRVRPGNWPIVDLPRDEYLDDGSSNIEDRFPSPAIFPKYSP